MASSSASKEKQQAPPQDSTSSERMDSFFSEMTTTMKWISWLTLALSIGYAILLVQPQPELDRAAIHAAAANYMGISPSSTNTRDGSPLRGLTVAITGATSGIGLELTRTLSGMGAHVVAIGRSSRKLEVLAREVDHVTTILADLTDLESVARAADDIVNTVPQLDILVNNAGIHLGFTWPWQRPSTVQGYDLVFGGTYVRLPIISIQSTKYMFCFLLRLISFSSSQLLVSLSIDGKTITETIRIQTWWSYCSNFEFLSLGRRWIRFGSSCSGKGKGHCRHNYGSSGKPSRWIAWLRSVASAATVRQFQIGTDFAHACLATTNNHN
jgi:hypothetical protein